MAERILPSVEVLRDVLRYEYDTGKLYWKSRPENMFNDTMARKKSHACRQWNSKNAGKEALTSYSGDGYRQGRIFSISFMAHRVIWAIFYGELPDCQIDHINCDKEDNRISNLRQANFSENASNVRLRADNTSGYKGVSWNKRMGQWQAGLSSNKNRVHVGYFDSAEDAYIAYCKAAYEYHGQFARVR